MSDTAEEQRPLVVTLQLEAPAQKRFDADRAELFPPGRTAVGAHVTMFHALPAYLRQDVEAELERLATAPPFPVEVTEIYALGRGVAYRLSADAAQQLHSRLRERWRPHLTRQDAQPFRPHVTVQNKVEPDVARATLDRLRTSFRPETTRAVGLELWRYDGGSWTLLRRWALGADTPSPVLAPQPLIDVRPVDDDASMDDGTVGSPPVGWIREIVLNATDPLHLARFWADLLGGEPVEWYDGWVTLEPPPHGQRLSFQRVDAAVAAVGMHFDVLVDELDSAHERAVAAGADYVEERWSPRPDDQGEPVRWRVYRDPVGHAFCLVTR